MQIRWRFRRSTNASADYGVFLWSRVPVGNAAATHTGTAAITETADTSSAAGKVQAKGAAGAGEGPDALLAFGTAARAPVVTVGPLSLPHDDYDDDYRPWWQYRRDPEEEKRKLDAMRREIGLLPPAVARQVERKTERAVDKAVVALSRETVTVDSEAHAFDLVAAYEREFQRALQGVLSKARSEDAEAAFRSAVKARVAADRAEQIEQDDADVLSLIEYLI